MELRSPAIPPGGTIPNTRACEGETLLPPAERSGLPSGTAAPRLTCDDPDAPRATFRHRAACNISRSIPGSATGLARGEAPPATAVGDSGKPGRAGPCPPRGGPAYRDVFRLAALTAPLEAQAGARCVEIQRLAGPLALGAAGLTGRFGR